ncbi:transposase [Chloroflexi bacterium TSY]|nr:transposase [Chloroflexi bacterium TSY]
MLLALPGTTLYTDECNAYNPIAETGRSHATVCHSRYEWARDDDGDGIREVHCNTMEGIWTGLRNFLRPFRVFINVILPNMLPSLNGLTISNLSMTPFFALSLTPISPIFIHEPNCQSISTPDTQS